MLPLSPGRHYRTFHADLALVAALLAPLGRDGLLPIGRAVGRGRCASNHHTFAPLRALGLPFGKPLRPWEEELRRVTAFTGREFLP